MTWQTKCVCGDIDDHWRMVGKDCCCEACYSELPCCDICGCKVREILIDCEGLAICGEECLATYRENNLSDPNLALSNVLIVVFTVVLWAIPIYYLLRKVL